MLAVSGGVDSRVLLDVCKRAERERKAHFEVAHVDHALRTESASDADFVAVCAKDAGLAFHLARVGRRAARGESVEAWARKERYQLLEQIRVNSNLDYIVTAHTADDLAETILMRLLANKDFSSLVRRDERRKLIRPFLSVTKDALIAYQRKFKLLFVEDASNHDQRFLRNKVRHQLVPFLMRSFDPRIIEVLAKRAELIAEDEEFLEEYTRAQVEVLQLEEWGTKAWFTKLRAILKDNAASIGERCVALLFLDKLRFKLGRQRSAEIREFILTAGAQISLPGGAILARKKGGLVIVGAKNAKILGAKR